MDKIVTTKNEKTEVMDWQFDIRKNVGLEMLLSEPGLESFSGREYFESDDNIDVKIKEESPNKCRKFKEEPKENFEEYDNKVHVKIQKEESTDENMYVKSVNKRRKIKEESNNDAKDGDEAKSNIGHLRAELQATRLQLKEAQEANDKLNYWAAFAAKKYEELTQIRLDSVQMKKEWEIAKKNKKEDLLLLKEAMEENDVKKSNNCKCYPLIKAYISTLDKWYSKDAEDGRWF